MTKLIKKLDNMEKCQKCNESMICKMTSGDNAHLQWQNMDGKSHYLPPKDDPDKPGKKIFGCRPAGQTSITSQTATKTIWDIIDQKSSDMIELQTGSNVMRSLAYENVKNRHPDMDNQGETFGKIVSAETGHLIGLAHIKAIKEAGVKFANS